MYDHPYYVQRVNGPFPAYEVMRIGEGLKATVLDHALAYRMVELLNAEAAKRVAAPAAHQTADAVVAGLESSS